jgi:hypothetical protein
VKEYIDEEEYKELKEKMLYVMQSKKKANNGEVTRKVYIDCLNAYKNKINEIAVAKSVKNGDLVLSRIESLIRIA